METSFSTIRFRLFGLNLRLFITASLRFYAQVYADLLFQAVHRYQSAFKYLWNRFYGPFFDHSTLGDLFNC